MPIGLGGVFGDMILKFPGLFLGSFPQGAIASGIALILAVPAFWLCLFASGIIGRGVGIVNPAQPSGRRGAEEDDFAADDEDDETSAGGGFQLVGALTHLVLTTTANFKRLTGLGRRRPRAEDFDDMRVVRRKRRNTQCAAPRTRFRGASGCR